MCCMENYHYKCRKNNYSLKLFLTSVLAVQGKESDY